MRTAAERKAREALGYLDEHALAALDVHSFRARQPYPWANPAGLLTEDGYRRLVETLPDASLFTGVFDRPRKHGQLSHDRYVLEWSPQLAGLAAPWVDFIAEINGPTYRRFLARLLGRDAFDLRLHWHYTPAGCSVSPHCDAPRKLGSHIFYFNTAADWDPAWGGETLVLDDRGRFSARSNPAFEDFEQIETAQALGNHSLLFARRGDSWHGVREIRCPPGHMRKVFIVVFERASLGRRLRQSLKARRRV